LALLPLIQLLVWRVSVAISINWTAEGTADPVKFWALVIFVILFGAG